MRHGEVESHRGDHPLTEAGREQASGPAAGWRRRAGSVRLLSGATRRARETAESASGPGWWRPTHSVHVTAPQVAFALRNPDLYLAGERVDMVSSAEAFAAQVPGMSPEEVLAVPFYSGFLGAPDRIAHWVDSARPPGD